MRITTWAEYGLICALHLARRAAEGPAVPVTGRDVAARERLPADYVEQILLRLRRAEIVRSQRGARGGYVLARPAAEISVREVIQASELETFELHCATNPVEEARCSAAHSCSIRPVWMMLQERIDEVLQSVRLSDLLDDELVVRARVGLGPRATAQLAEARAGKRRPLAGTARGAASDLAEPPARARRLPVLQD